MKTRRAPEVLRTHTKPSWCNDDIRSIDDDRWTVVIAIGIAFTFAFFLVFTITFPFSFDLTTTIPIYGLMIFSMIIIPAAIT